MNNSEWLEAVRLYKAYWPQATLSDATIAAWGAGLADLDGKRVHQALYDLAQHHRWPPSLADIRTRCRDIGRAHRLARGISDGRDGPDYPTDRCECGALLLLAFDGNSDRCRHCAKNGRTLEPTS